MDHFTIQEMIKNGWPVLSVLLIMSVISATVIIDRLLTFRRCRVDHGAFIARLLEILGRGGRAEALAFCGKHAKPISSVAAEILRGRGDRETMERASQFALQTQINELENFVPILGTIASTAPFVGLFGTVIGIIKAFQDISSNLGGGPEVVAAGIAEALITTAVGLFVAIPATMAYNYFVRHIQTVTREIDLAAYKIIEKAVGA